MKRLATLVLTAGFVLCSLVLTGRGASATPFSDIPANHWAYQAIQSLAADGLVEGYPDGKFKGDRPMTRYEMAVLVARVIAKVQAGMPNLAPYATKADLDKLQKLIDAFKDELDALGVRVTNLEDSLDALDKRTKFAQSIEFHGFMQPQITLRQRYTLPRTVAGGLPAATNLPGTPYWAMDNAYISSDFTNSAYTQNGTSNTFRYDDRFTFVYHVNDNLTVSIPLHLVSSTYGGEWNYVTGSGGQGQSGTGDTLGIKPGVDITVARTGAITNLLIKFGIQDNIRNSRTGLAYKGPDISEQATFETPQMPYQTGFSMTGTLNGLTDFQVFWNRLDQFMLNTQTGVLYNNYANGFNSFLFNVVPNQIGYTQAGYPGVGGTASQTLTFTAGVASLPMVYLTNKALIGTVYVSQYNGTLYNSAGQIIGGGTNAAPAFTFDDALNAVTFSPPLPAGSSVSVTFVSLGNSSYNVPARYDVGGRVNQRISGLPGAEIGFTFNRVYDLDDLQCTGAVCSVQTGSLLGAGLISDTVFALDAQLPLGFNISGPNSQPVLFGEIANSKFTPDFRNIQAYSDNAWVGGVNPKMGRANGVFQYQSIGANFISGAPFRYYGNPPPTFAYWKQAYFPAFYGFANTLGLNKAFDAQFAGTAVASPATSASTVLSYMTPMFNPFIAGGPNWYSAFTPNTQGVVGNVNVPFTVGELSFAGRVAGAHLTEVRPNSVAAMQYGAGYSSGVKEQFDRLEGALNFTVPVFQQRLALGLGMSWDRLLRNDPTLFQYYPFNPSTGGNDPASVAAALAAYTAGGCTAVGGCTYAGGGSQVSWAPNYINVQHWTTNITAALPVTRGITLTGLYNAQSFGGFYQSLGQNMDERKIFAVGGITYTIPNSPSTLSFTFRNQKYIDGVVPTFNLNQNREDVTYAIRF